MLPKKFRKFHDGDTLTAQGYDIVIRRKKIGDLEMPSGNLVACDPLHYMETEPFETHIDAGTYPVVLLIAQLRDDKRVAYAMVRIRNTETLRWEEAHLPNDSSETITDQSDAGFPVDSSVACFMDADTATMLLDYTHAVMPDDDEFERALHSGFNRHRKHGYSWACVHLKRDVKLPHANNMNLCAFESGFGPGVYQTWIGYDEDDEVSKIVTDFEVLDLTFNTFPWGG